LPKEDRVEGSREIGSAPLTILKRAYSKAGNMEVRRTDWRFLLFCHHWFQNLLVQVRGGFVLGFLFPCGSMCFFLHAGQFLLQRQHLCL
jgi:hypothetical protein